jgi:hypothetical protein
VQTLTILQERIYDAWRERKVLSSQLRRQRRVQREIPQYTKLKSTIRRKPKVSQHERRTQFEARKGGRYTKRLDRALPGTHTRKLYDSLKPEEVQILSQLRTGKNRLNSALYVVKAAKSDRCERCNRPETVRHFLTECPQWATLRQTYLQTATDRWTDVPFLLGAWTNERVDGLLKRWIPNRGAVRATIAFARATGRLSCSPEERR